VFFSIYVLTVGLGGTYVAGDGNAVVIYPALAPMLIIPMLFDAAKSIYINVLAISSLVAVAVATAMGLAYAPAIVQRSLDVYQSPAVQMGVIALIIPPAVIGAILMVIVGAATRRERAMLAETRDRLDSAVSLISRYVPAELASGILAGTEAPATGYRRQKVTSFFSDIVGFTELAEEMEPEDLARILNEYFTDMAAIAERHHGTVDELQGDGLILVFGAPTFRSDREHALDAVRAASDMQATIGSLNDRWRHDGLDVAIQVRMGINTGVVTVGHFGSGNRLKYTVLGKHVNLAARIQAMCEPGRVLVSHATWLLINDDVETRSLGVREFKGITRPVEVHELV
jgi:class 3 adenylate cyclase